MWRPFEDGTTVGLGGSEDGIILVTRSMMRGHGSRFEQGCAHGVPFAVTCGIYGWFFHTRLLGSEAEAEFPAMHKALAAILDIIPRADDPKADAKMAPVSDAIKAFVSQFP